MIDLKQLNLGSLLDTFVGSGLAGGLAGGALANVLMTKGGRKAAGHALQIGGIALLGGLAYKAWQNHQQAKRVGARAAAPMAVLPTPAADSGFLPASGDAEGQTRLGLLLLRAMIAAAKADGQLDAHETQRLFGAIDHADLSAQEKALLLEEIGQPLALEALVAQVTTAQQAAEVYAASVLVMGARNDAENAYLAQLAQRLDIEPALARELEASVAAVRAAPEMRATA